MSKFGINDINGDPNADNLRKYIEECRMCGEETLIGEDYRAWRYPANHFVHDTSICTDCKTELFEREDD